MKKLAVLLCLAFWAGVVVNKSFAQDQFPLLGQSPDEHEHRGRFFVGGAASLWEDSKVNRFTLGLNPELGYLLNDRWGVGLILGYEYEHQGEGETREVTRAFKITPFVRYSYLHKGPFNLYLDAGLGYNISREKAAGEVVRRSGFELGLRPGACVDLTEGLCLCLRMGFLGYRNIYFMGEEPKLGERGWGLNLSPEELMIGLELEI